MKGLIKGVVVLGIWRCCEGILGIVEVVFVVYLLFLCWEFR